MSSSPAASETLDGKLRRLLEKLDSKDGVQLSSKTLDSQLDPLFSAFQPSTPDSSRPAAFLVLSRIVSNARQNLASQTNYDNTTKNLSRLFVPGIDSRLSTTSPPEIVSALALLAALFQVDQAAGTEIILRDGFLETIMDMTDLLDGEDGRNIRLAVTALLSQASGSATCRPVISAHATPWLREQVQGTNDRAMQASAAITLTKLSRGSEDAAAGSPGVPASSTTDDQRGDTDDSLARLMKSLVLSPSELSPSSQGMLDAVEGLAYASTDSKTKEMLASDADFLSRLFSLVPPPKKHQTGAIPTVTVESEHLPPSQPKGNLALLYGIAVIIVNLVSFRSQLSEEEEQVERLKRMTKEGAKTGNKLSDPMGASEDPLETAGAVKRRCKRLLKAGVMPALVSMSSRSESEGLRSALGNAFVSLVEEQGNRGKIVQAGGVKALLSIISGAFAALEASLTPSTKPRHKFDSVGASTTTRALDAKDLYAIQALAKLSITASPLLLFGPDPSSSIDAIRPVAHLLLAPSSTLLQRFEALMALTNIASLGPALASRVARHKEDGLGTLVNRTEALLLEDNTMVRRAATELLCNLVSSDEIWERYTGEGPDGKSSDVADSALMNRLRLLLAMADVDDIPTRLAASGALAMLGSSSNVGRILFEVAEGGPQKTLRVLADLLSPDDTSENDVAPTPEQRHQLVYRGVLSLRNIMLSYAADRSRAVGLENLVAAAKEGRLAEALVVVLTSPENVGNQEMLAAGAELLKWLMGHGIEVVL